MPKRSDITSVLVIGSGPIVIGQACEFDYSGTQACRVLQAEGIRVSLVNSNPATIMTDPEFADATYIEPITPEFVEQVIAAERPDAILATLGGQTALNTAVALHERGVLDHRDVDAPVPVAELVGAPAQRAGEDLVAEADAEERHLAAQHLLGEGDGVRGGGRVARAVGEEDAVGTPYGTAHVSHVCLNDDVVEGLELRSAEGALLGFSVQYHPESAAGPHDAAYLFDRFVQLMTDRKGAA